MLLLLTSLTHTGGIEEFNRRLIREVAALGTRDGEPVYAVSLLDSEPTIIGAGPEAVTVHPAGGSRAKFVVQAVVIGLRRRPRVVLAGLVNFAPLAYLLSATGVVGGYAIQLYGSEAWERLPFHRRFALCRANTVAAITQFTAEQAARANGLVSTSVRLLSPVLDESWFARAANRVSTDDVHRGPAEVLSVARLDSSEGKKGIDRVLEALASTGLVERSWKYRVVGDGTDRPRLEQLASDLGIRDRVDFLGGVPSAELHRCFERCDVFVLPSTQEGFGIVFLEAAAYGKPVIGARSGGIPEVVLHAETGILVDPADAADLRTSIVSLLCDQELRERLGRNGRSRVEEHFRLANFRSQLDAVMALPRRTTRSARRPGT